MHPDPQRPAPFSTIYRELIEREEQVDLVELGHRIWARWVLARGRTWALPLTPTYSTESAVELLEADSLSLSTLPRALASAVRNARIDSGDQVLFLVDGTIRSLGQTTLDGTGNSTWALHPFDGPYPGEAPRQMQMLTPAARSAALAAKTNARHWKIAPGRGAEQWDDWRNGRFAAIGWTELGDLTRCTREEFGRRVELAAAERPDDYKMGVNQVWDFLQITPGDLLIANKGTGAVVGVGRVTSGYYFDPGGEYPHRLQVEWFDVRERTVDRRPAWVRTLMRLAPEDFGALVGAVVPPPLPPASPRTRTRKPENLILFGPPGTGKTWSVVDEALRLIGGKRDERDRAAKVADFDSFCADGQIDLVTFHQSYGYEDFVEGLRPLLDSDASGQVRYEMHHGAFLRMALRAAGAGLMPPTDDPGAVQQALDDRTVPFAFDDSTTQYVLVIDEINRGNISRILGELITLLEPDKRLGGEFELRVKLSSGRTFAVPPNLHIVATMNTADRSIALLDVALRRRFRFREMKPDDKALRTMLAEAGAAPAHIGFVAALFNCLNRRIRFLRDADHQLGHALFGRATDLFALRDVFLDGVIPLLQEYFYGSWDRMCLVLGCPVDGDGEPTLVTGRYPAPMIAVERMDEAEVIGFDHADFESRLDMQVNPAFIDATDADDLRAFFDGVLSTSTSVSPGVSA
jgi:hypothetical protein